MRADFTTPPSLVTAAAQLTTGKSMDLRSANLMNAELVPGAAFGTSTSRTISPSASTVLRFMPTAKKSSAAMARFDVRDLGRPERRGPARDQTS